MLSVDPAPAVKVQTAAMPDLSGWARHRSTTTAPAPPVTVTEAPTTTEAPVPETSPPETTARARVTTPATEAPVDTEAPARSGSNSGTGSFYTTAENGTGTASGIPLDDSAYTFAHRTMGFHTAVHFCGPAGCITAICTDRGPYVAGRTFDFSAAAMTALKGEADGVVTVTWDYA